METILAIDLGKHKSVFCKLDTSSLKPEYFERKDSSRKSFMTSSCGTWCRKFHSTFRGRFTGWLAYPTCYMPSGSWVQGCQRQPFCLEVDQQPEQKWQDRCSPPGDDVPPWIFSRKCISLKKLSGKNAAWYITAKRLLTVWHRIKNGILRSYDNSSYRFAQQARIAGPKSTNQSRLEQLALPLWSALKTTAIYGVASYTWS